MSARNPKPGLAIDVQLTPGGTKAIDEVSAALEAVRGSYRRLATLLDVKPSLSRGFANEVFRLGSAFDGDDDPATGAPTLRIDLELTERGRELVAAFWALDSQIRVVEGHCELLIERASRSVESSDHDRGSL